MRPGLAIAILLSACGGDDSAEARDAGASTCATDDDCTDGVFCNGAETCDGADPGADSRGCVAADAPCLASQTCDETGGECLSDCDAASDADGDGHDAMSCGGSDCDDADAMRFPGNTEVCDVDDHDEDCDPTTFGVRDADMDGWPDAACCNEAGGTTTCGTDCDDTVSAVHPTQVEVCNELDDDCDGSVDEGVAQALCPDADGDLHGDASAMPVMACPMIGFVANCDDCDDGNACAFSTSAPEICDMCDNDCDGSLDEGAMAVGWWPDMDGDGWGTGDPTMPLTTSCTPVAGHATRAGDCDDGNTAVSPGAVEACTGLDDDCDGSIDEIMVTGCTGVTCFSRPAMTLRPAMPRRAGGLFIVYEGVCPGGEARIRIRCADTGADFVPLDCYRVGARSTVAALPGGRIRLTPESATPAGVLLAIDVEIL